MGKKSLAKHRTRLFFFSLEYEIPEHYLSLSEKQVNPDLKKQKQKNLSISDTQTQNIYFLYLKHENPEPSFFLFEANKERKSE